MCIGCNNCRLDVPEWVHRSHWCECFKMFSSPCPSKGDFEHRKAEAATLNLLQCPAIFCNKMQHTTPNPLHYLNWSNVTGMRDWGLLLIFNTVFGGRPNKVKGYIAKVHCIHFTITICRKIHVTEPSTSISLIISLCHWANGHQKPPLLLLISWSSKWNIKCHLVTDSSNTPFISLLGAASNTNGGECKITKAQHPCCFPPAEMDNSVITEHASFSSLDRG